MLNARAARRGFGRTLLTGGVAVAALFGTMATNGSAAPATPATPAQEAPPYIDDGRATGRANVVSVAPTAGALQLALGSGEVIAETAGALAQARSSAADLGLIGSSLTAVPCNGGDPALTPEQLPQALQVDNRSGPATADASEGPVPIPGVATGRKQVEATTTPSSRAVVTSGDLAIPGVLAVAGGQATAEAEVFPGAGREARSSVIVDVVLPGGVELRGLQWSARHRTGGEDGAEGTFSIDALAVAGVELPIQDVQGILAAANAVLNPLGLSLQAPTVERVQQAQADFVRVTPLQLVVFESPASELLVRPALDATRDFRSQVFDALTAVECRLSSILLVADIGVGVLAGTGTLVASIGGVEATTATVVIEDLFGHGGGLPPAPVIDSGDGAVTGGPAPAAAGGGPVVAPGPIGGIPTPAAASSAAAQGPFDTICENVHPNRKPSCSEGAAAVVGLAGLAATVGVGALDLRRRRRLAPMALGAAS